MKLVATSLVALLLFAGCSETKKEEKTTSAPTTGGIEVVKNDDAFKDKVKAKESDGKNQKYYYDYNNDNSVNEDKTYTKMDANLRVRSPYEQVEIELLVHKLSKDFIVRCSACHNDYANGIIGPSLLGKDAKFIAETIGKYKTGEKVNVLMTALVKEMSDEQISKLANEIEAFNKEIATLRGKK